MKTTSRLFLPALFFVLCISCNLTVDEKLVIGDWKGVEWLVTGQDSDYDASTTFFSFLEDGKYTYQYGDMGEEGEYYVVNNELFTTPNGGMKMMVRIKTLTQDTMVLNMNRGGTSESLTLARR
jgi:hypothetical protein